MTAPLPPPRFNDGTWPTPGRTIWHKTRRYLHLHGYTGEEGFTGLAELIGYGFNSGDFDTRETGPEPGQGENSREWVNVHWDDIWTHEKATLNGRPFHGRVSQTPWSVLQNVRLHGRDRIFKRGRRIRLVREVLARAHARGVEPFFELKSKIPLVRLLEVHDLALKNGMRYALMAMPENLHYLDGPAYRLLLARGRVTARQWQRVNAAKGPAAWTKPTPFGKGRFGGRSRLGRSVIRG